MLATVERWTEKYIQEDAVAADMKAKIVKGSYRQVGSCCKAKKLQANYRDSLGGSSPLLLTSTSYSGGQTHSAS
jgi:hypothetical protein